MTRAFTLVLLAFNVLAVAGAVATLQLLDRRSLPFSVAEFERGLGERLSRVTTPEQMRESRTELAHLSASGHSLVRQAYYLTGRTILFALTVAAVNVAIVGAGFWYAKAQTRKNI